MSKACVNMKPVNVGSCDAHLTRRKAYMNAIPEDARYTRRDLENRNEVWSFFAESVKDYYSLLCRYIKKSTGREVGGTRKMRDPKTGRMKEYSSVTPMWDMVVLIKDNTTKDDVQKFMNAVEERFHIRPVKAAIHRDEGHYDDENKWIPNLHAHIIWDRISKEDERAGRVIKLEKQDMSELQTMAANIFGMEQGVSKNETQKRHLERDELIRKKQEDKLNEVSQMDGQIEQKRQEVELLIAKGEELRVTNTALTDENNAKATELLNLRLRESQAETRIAKLDESNGNFVLNRLASLFGKGDFDQKVADVAVALTAAEQAKTDAETTKAEAEKVKAEAEKAKAEYETAKANVKAEVWKDVATWRKEEHDTAYHEAYQKTWKQWETAVHFANRRQDEADEKEKAFVTTLKDIIMGLPMYLYQAIKAFLHEWRCLGGANKEQRETLKTGIEAYAGRDTSYYGKKVACISIGQMAAAQYKYIEKANEWGSARGKVEKIAEDFVKANFADDWHASWEYKQEQEWNEQVQKRQQKQTQGNNLQQGGGLHR